MFGGMAILGLVIIAPKHARRHAGLVQRYEARTRAQSVTTTQAGDDSETVSPEPQTAEAAPGGDVWPLLVVMGAIVVAAAAGLVIVRLRSRRCKPAEASRNSTS